MSRFFLTAVCVAFCSAPANAALDPESDEPYHLQVVLHVAEHRLLTPVFKDQVERELRDGLQAAFGDLAKVEVVRTHPRLKEVLADGLAALDGWKDVAAGKTHFVLIDYADGRYDIQARQYDGPTALASPVVRRERTPDRQFVARAAALLVNRDFGLAGTVVDQANPERVRVALKGGGLGVPLGPWVQEGEVFAVVQVRRGAGGERAQRVEWALLQVVEKPKDGACVCRLFQRHADALAGGAGVLGYRCLKLGTARGPLHLRLVKARARSLTPPDQSLEVHVRRDGFQGKAHVYQGVTDADGFFRTDRDPANAAVFDHAAFVSVLSGGEVKAQIPVPIVDERTVVVPVSITADPAADLLVNRDRLVTELNESVLVYTDLFKDLGKAMEKPDGRQPAHDRAQARLQDLQGDLARFEERLRLLRPSKLDLAVAEQRVKDLHKFQDDLQRFVAGLEKILKEENDPARKELLAKVEQAKLLEEQAEFDKALGLYEAAWEGLKDPALRKKLDELKEGLKFRDDRHRQAHEFIYLTWPALTPAQLPGRLGEAQQAFAACRDAGDVLRPRKLLRAAIAHAERVNEEALALASEAREDDEKKAKALAEAADGLKKLIQEVSAFLAKEIKLNKKGD
jgi:hypothetical protein